MNEQWRVCASFPDYEVSDLGRVRRCTPGVNTHVGRIVVGYRDKNGYHCALLRHNGRRKLAKVHRLVAAEFIGPIPYGMQVNHKNGITSDNRLENLEIVSPRENMLHSFRTLGRVMHKKRAKGEAHGNAKLTESEIREIRRLYANGASAANLSERFHTTTTHVYRIAHRLVWAHVTD